MLGARKALIQGDCATVHYKLGERAGYGELTDAVNAEIAFLRAQCLELEGKPGEAMGSYIYIVDNYPSLEYAYRASGRIAELKGLFNSTAIIEERNSKYLDPFRAAGGRVYDTWKFDQKEEGWKRNTQDANNIESIVEYVREDQEDKNWTEAVVSRASLTGGSMRVRLAQIQDQVFAGCRKTDFKVISTNEFESLYTWQHDECQGRPPEREVVKLVITDYGSHSIHYLQTKGGVNEKRFKDYRNKFATYKVELGIDEILSYVKREQQNK